MDYKYNIHLTEDIAQHVKAIRKLLGFDYANKASEGERTKLCNEWFCFKRFKHPGEAIEYYEQGNRLPDLKIQDIDFTELSAKEVPEKFRTNISGIYEIEYLTRRNGAIGKSRQKNGVEIIPYSGKLDDEYIFEALAKSGWERETISTIEEITKSRLMKDDQVRLKLRIVGKLKELALKYFEKLSEGERTRLENMTKAGIQSDWNNYIVRFEDFEFRLKNLLVGFGDIHLMSPKDISLIVKNLLDTSSIKISFLGWWKEGEICNQLLKPYWADTSNYERNKKIINLKTVDFILEVMKFQEEGVFDEQVQIDISKGNALYKIGYRPTGVEKERVFTDKIIGRRVAIAVSYIYENVTDFDFGNVCSLITRGKTNAVTNLDDLLSKTVSEYLGLKRDGKKVIVHRDTVMREEMELINSYVIHLKALRSFLNEYEPSVDITKGFTYAYGDYFLDLSSLNEFVFAYQIFSPTNLPKLITEILTNISSDSKYKGAEKILYYSNSLFM